MASFIKSKTPAVICESFIIEPQQSFHCIWNNVLYIYFDISYIHTFNFLIEMPKCFSGKRFVKLHSPKIQGVVHPNAKMKQHRVWPVIRTVVTWEYCSSVGYRVNVLTCAKNQWYGKSSHWDVDKCIEPGHPFPTMIKIVGILLRPKAQFSAFWSKSV